MTSLTDVYEGEVGRVASRRQQVAGTALVGAGLGALVAAIALATTDVGAVVGLGDYAAREVAGIVAGVGLPAVVFGVFAVLPASRRVRATALVGVALSLLGVAAFRSVYPNSWMANDPLLALGVSAVYLAGVLTTFWCLFAALATFETRKAPGGTARMRITEAGTIELVEEARPIPGLGGVGLLGSDPDGGVETQTNRSDAGRGTVSDGGEGEVLGAPSTGSTDGGSDAAGGAGGTDAGTRDAGAGDRQAVARADSSGSTTPSGPSEREVDADVATAGPEASNGGTTTQPTGHDPITETAAHRGEPDSYCGNCRHFQYVMADGDIQPHCTFHGEALDDMEACSAWVEND
ncbi:DUF7139 domain-containing protein [Haloarcula litorea]|uniref:DUF7139 domain-containing protein n=1 Tax=Haloarcula litorea TaxID=3032579 RepID=UPI0023E7DD3D|nr:hypothetical protein [Halomicroarcula sp. GDY20]